MTHPCANHPCDNCGWCTGALNHGIPICCLTLPASALQHVAASTSTDSLHPDPLHQAITDELAGQPAFSDLLGPQDLSPVVRCLLAAAPDAESVPPVTTPEHRPSDAALGPTEQPALPPPSLSLTDLLTHTTNRKEQHHGIARPDER